MQKRVVFVANTTWYLYNFRLALIKALKEKKYQVIVIAPFDEAVNNFKKVGIHCYHLPLNRKGILPFSNLKTLVALSYRYVNIQPNLIFHFTIKPVIFGTLMAKIFTQAEVINNITGLGYVFINQTYKGIILKKMAHFLYRLALDNSLAITFQNEADRAYFLENDLIRKTRNKVYVIPGSGVDLFKFNCHRHRQPEKSKIKFILVGRMLWDKGIGEYVTAITTVKRKYPTITFQILGPIDNGNPAGIEEKKINEWVEKGYIEYFGKVDDIRPYLKAADVFVLPSYREGLSKSIIEAMAMRMPIITTNAPGCRETVVPYSNGLLVSVKNPKELADAMEYFIDNPEAILIMGNNSRKLVEERFSDQEIVSSFLKIIE